MDGKHNQSLIEILMAKGVQIPCPQSVDIGPEVDPKRISGHGVILHAGCKIYGAQTLISDGVQVGYETPATVSDCYLGPDVRLKGGFFERATFLEGAQMGSGAHVREGTILEEQASGAHTVGLKQTILLPYVTLGSLINFCDCLMSGGTSRKNHSEVGSSYIHFNYTPHQDKATPSILGDVPRGIMLDQNPIFLGGQGGLVGPCRIYFGNIIAAGSIYRKDETSSGNLLFAGSGRGGRIPFTPGSYIGLGRIWFNNVYYIANLIALGQWYRHVRSMFVGSRFPAPLLAGLENTLATAVAERIKRLEQLCDKLPASIAAIEEPDSSKRASANLMLQKEILSSRTAIFENLNAHLEAIQDDQQLRDAFLKNLQKEKPQHSDIYLKTIHGLTADSRKTGTAWLDSIVTKVVDDIMAHTPAYDHHRPKPIKK